MDSEHPYHLFVVEDDVALRDMLRTYLERQGLTVTTMASAEELLQRMTHLRPDLVVLDVGLPRLSGLEACQRLRADGDRVPIILLTARGEEIDRVLGLEMGADDYLAKPFSARELLARVRAVLRRTHFVPNARRGVTPVVSIGEHVFQVATRSLQRGDESRVLNTVEYALLAELTAHPGVTLSRERLMAASHGRADSISVRAIDAAVVRLRRLVEPDPAVPRFIQTVRGFGYVFIP